jgi:hypothetical protein
MHDLLIAKIEHPRQLAGMQGGYNFWFSVRM